MLGRAEGVVGADDFDVVPPPWRVPLMVGSKAARACSSTVRAMGTRCSGGADAKRALVFCVRQHGFLDAEDGRDRAAGGGLGCWGYCC